MPRRTSGFVALAATPPKFCDQAAHARPAAATSTTTTVTTTAAHAQHGTWRPPRTTAPGTASSASWPAPPSRRPRRQSCSTTPTTRARTATMAKGLCRSTRTMRAGSSTTRSAPRSLDVRDKRSCNRPATNCMQSRKSTARTGHSTTATMTSPKTRRRA